MNQRWAKGALLVLGSWVGLASCATPQMLTEHLRIDAGYCDPPQLYRFDSTSAPLADIRPLLSPALSARFTPRLLLVANACGLLPQLRELVRLEGEARQHPSAAATAAISTQRQTLLAQVQLISVAEASVAAELDCEGERAEQVADYLGSLASQRTQRLTVASIGAGALASIGTAVVNTPGGQYGFGVGGGLLTAGLGLLSLSSHRTLPFKHPRNLLTDVWNESPQSPVYPPAVWYMLSDPHLGPRPGRSQVHSIRQRWLHYGQLDAARSASGNKPCCSGRAAPTGPRNWTCVPTCSTRYNRWCAC